MIKTYKITVNGKSYDVTVEETDKKSQPMQENIQAVASVATEQKEEPVAKSASINDVEAIGAIKAPMPGKVMKFAVSKGDKVQEGQLLLTLEAMKMENEIFSPASGTVSDIIVSCGDNVNTGDTLLIIA